MSAPRVEGEATPDATKEAGEAAAAPVLLLEDLLPDPGVLPRQEREAEAPRRAAAPGMRTALVTALTGRKATLGLRGQAAPVEAVIAPEVDPAVIEDARVNGDSVLVEIAEGEAPLVVGVLQTRRPREIRLQAATVLIEGDEVLLRSGRGAIRLRKDGDIEVVGSRINAASRGLFRIVGRILRLN